LFKVGTALVFAVIAALTVILAGLLANARYSVVFFRALTGFLVAGLLIYLAAFLFERYELPAFWRRQTRTETAEDEPDEPDADAVPDGDAAGNTEEIAAADHQQEETSERKAAESGGKDAFVPLATDGLKHVSSPQD